MAKKFAKLGQAEIIIANQLKYAAALKYNAGQVPQVLVIGSEKDFTEIIWKAQELDIPIVENALLTAEIFNQLKEGSEIPDEFYKAVAQSLALIYKIPSKPKSIRYIKILTKVPSKIKNEINTLYKEHSDSLIIHPVKIELGKLLYKKKDFYRESFNHLRQKIILDLGLILPEFVILENKDLKDWQFIIFLKEIPYLDEKVEAIPERQENLLKVTHKAKQVIYQNAQDLLGYLEVEAYLKDIEKTKPSIIKELFPDFFSITSFKAILKNLLKEQVPIRDLGTILEVVKENLATTSDPDILTEYIRSAFKKYLFNKYKDEEGNLNVIALDHKTESLIASSLKTMGKSIVIDLSPENGLKILTKIGNEIKKAHELNIKPAILSSPNLRRFIRRVTEHTFYEIPIIAYSEIPPQTKVNSISTIAVDFVIHEDN